MGLAKTILVAEDDPVTRRFVVSLLEERGYEVLVAEDGEHALELAKSASPDLLVSDLVMPYRDGFEVLRAIRNDAKIAHLPVLILSMRDHEDDIVRGLESGADEYVVKPFNARELVARVKKLLEPRRA
ncbi:MAG TPA: response regulator [Candidatus Polarisedimenticolaceae bacterium]|nr:response regulator [Candidatus Polarisedimenticolaceae bacterium]